MIQTAIAALLTDRFGFDAEIIGRDMVQRAVRDRMEESGYTDPASYLLRLQSSFQELELLGERLLVPETWFFRDQGPFDYLQRHARSHWIVPGEARRRFRLLSLPCSTGDPIRWRWLCSMSASRPKPCGSMPST